MDNLFHWRVAVPAIITSIISLIILVVFDLINRFLKKKVTKISIYIPGQLIVVSVCILAVPVIVFDVFKILFCHIINVIVKMNPNSVLSQMNNLILHSLMHTQTI